MPNHSKHSRPSSAYSASGVQKKTPRINSQPTHQARCTSFHGIPAYGELVVGERGIEFYNDKNERDFIQIPWEEVDTVSASVMMGGKMISRFFVNTKRNGTFAFSAKDNKAALRAVRDVIGNERVVRENTVVDNLKKAFGKTKKK